MALDYESLFPTVPSKKQRIEPFGHPLVQRSLVGWRGGAFPQSGSRLDLDAGVAPNKGSLSLPHVDLEPTE
jgi:hypothetical protein